MLAGLRKLAQDILDEGNDWPISYVAGVHGCIHPIWSWSEVSDVEFPGMNIP